MTRRQTRFLSKMKRTTQRHLATMSTTTRKTCMATAQRVAQCTAVAVELALGRHAAAARATAGYAVALVATPVGATEVGPAVWDRETATWFGRRKPGEW